MNVAQEFARNVGFAVRKENTNKFKGAETRHLTSRVRVVCSRFGQPRLFNEDNRTRKRGSDACGCEWVVLLKYDLVRQCYVFRDHGLNKYHSHELLAPEHNLYAAQHRSPSEEISRQASDIDARIPGLPLRTILEFLRFLNPGVDIRDPQDIRNAISRSRAKDGANQLVVRLRQRKEEEGNDFHFEYTVDADDRLTRVFWMGAEQTATM